jgi:polyphosphate kinase
VTDPGHEERLRDLIALATDDSTASWWLDPDGLWTRHHIGPDGVPLRDLQAYLVEQIRRSGRPAPEADGRAKSRALAEGNLPAQRPSPSGGTGAS